jgi:copper chaperone for superoxide dismutase
MLPKNKTPLLTSPPGAAVSILETFHTPALTPPTPPSASHHDRLVRGLARLVQVSPSTTLVDLTLRGVAPGTYHATVREYGNLASGAVSAGPVWSGSRGVLGTVTVGAAGHGSAFLSHPFQIWEIIGRALVVSPRRGDEGSPLTNDEDTVVGVIARSAGVWDNDKTVCSCTGKTLWEERREEVGKGML